MTAKTEKLPGKDAEKQLKKVTENKADVVSLRRKRIKLRYLCYEAMSKVTDVMLNSDKNDLSVPCKCAAAIRLNGYWKIKLFWWVTWRWYYYVRQYRNDEIEELIETGKKKVPLKSYLKNTILLTAMKDTIMQMSTEEAENILRGQYGEASGRQ